VSRIVYDFSDPADARLAGAALATIVGSEAWEVLIQLASHQRERDLGTNPADVSALAALNGKGVGRKELLAAAALLSQAALAAPAPQDTIVADIMAFRTSPPGSGPV
jgi:hypothetical protein